MYPSTSSSSPYPYRSPAIGRPSLLPVGSLYTTETEGFDAKVVVMGNSGKPASIAFALHWPHMLKASVGFPSSSFNRPAVGKTSLLQRFANNDFNPSSTKATTGALFVTKKVLVDGLKVRLQLWDTAGQERFRSMVSHSPPVCAYLPSPFPLRLCVGSSRLRKMLGQSCSDYLEIIFLSILA